MDATYACSQCKQRLSVSFEEGVNLAGSASGLTRLDESFLVLEEANRAAGQDAGTSARRLEESFVVLPGGGRGGGDASRAAAVPRVPFDQRLRALSLVFEVASGETKVDFPLCADCAAEVHKEMEGQLAEAQAELADYEAALARLQAEGARPMEERQFQRELRRLQNEEELELDKVARLQRELAVGQAELAALEARGREDHVDEREALSHRIEATCTALNMLKRTNVYSDVFKIWFDGPFGTISGLRLGRTSSQHVEWDEINAAWGQAVLLLSTLAQACGAAFSQYRLLPMGSFPRVADARGTYDLYGPVGFLTCLKEFAEWLRARGASEGAGRGPLVLPWEIEGDRVGGQSLKLLLQKDKNWTKALKYMLVDLKFCLKFAVALLDRTSAAGHGVVALQREGPARGACREPVSAGGKAHLASGAVAGPVRPSSIAAVTAYYAWYYSWRLHPMRRFVGFHRLDVAGQHAREIFTRALLTDPADSSANIAIQAREREDRCAARILATGASVGATTIINITLDASKMAKIREISLGVPHEVECLREEASTCLHAFAVMLD
eukprot:scaffold8.g1491.t1